jgi:hypothetical protein
MRCQDTDVETKHLISILTSCKHVNFGFKFVCFLYVLVAFFYRDLVLHIDTYIQYVPLMPRGMSTRPCFFSLHRCFLYLLHMFFESFWQ